MKTKQVRIRTCDHCHNPVPILNTCPTCGFCNFSTPIVLMPENSSLYNSKFNLEL